jgi:hypothetical protein
LTTHFLERKAAEHAILKSELEKHEKDEKHVEQSSKISIAEEAPQ